MPNHGAEFVTGGSPLAVEIPLWTSDLHRWLLLARDESMSMPSLRMFSRPVLHVVAPLLVTIALAGCGSDDAVGVECIGQCYEATFWTATTGNTTTDILAAGGSFEIVLLPQGTTTGRLFIPGSVTGEGDFNSNLAGTWTQSGSVVEFEHTADTFVRDMPFTVQGSTLVGDRSFGDLRIRVTLSPAQ